jgi:hypothetical protein
MSVRLTTTLRALHLEQQAAREGSELEHRFGASVLDDKALEEKEAPLNADERFMMDRIFDPAAASTLPTRLSQAPGRPRVAPSTSADGIPLVPPPDGGDSEDSNDSEESDGGDGGDGGRGPEKKGSRAARRRTRLAPSIREYVESCDRYLRSLDLACRISCNAFTSADRVLQHRKQECEDKRSQEGGEAAGGAQALAAAEDELRSLCLQPGGCVRAWRADLAKIRALYKKKYGAPPPPHIEEQARFLWEQARKRTTEHLPRELQHATVVAKAMSTQAQRKTPPEEVISYIFNGAGPSVPKKARASRAASHARAATPGAPPLGVFQGASPARTAAERAGDDRDTQVGAFTSPGRPRKRLRPSPTVLASASRPAICALADRVADERSPSRAPPGATPRRDGDGVSAESRASALSHASVASALSPDRIASGAAQSMPPVGVAPPEAAGPLANSTSSAADAAETAGHPADPGAFHARMAPPSARAAGAAPAASLLQPPARTAPRAAPSRTAPRAAFPFPWPAIGDGSWSGSAGTTMSPRTPSRTASVAAAAGPATLVRRGVWLGADPPAAAPSARSGLAPIPPRRGRAAGSAPGEAPPTTWVDAGPLEVMRQNWSRGASGSRASGGERPWGHASLSPRSGSAPGLAPVPRLSGREAVAEITPAESMFASLLPPAD